jgi:hypothetical protein
MTSLAEFGNGNSGGAVKTRNNLLSKKSTASTVVGALMLVAMLVAVLRQPWRHASGVVNSATSAAGGAGAGRGADASENNVSVVGDADAIGSGARNASAAVRRCCSAAPCFDCSSVQALLEQTRNLPAFGRGFYKQAHLVASGGRTFVLKSLHDASASYLSERYFAKNGRALSDEQLQQRLVDKFASECHQMLDWHRQLAVPIVPHVHGGCHERGAPVVTVVERLRTLTDVTFDATVPLSSRVALAISTMRLVAEWDRLEPFNHSRADTDVISSLKDYRVVNATALIYGDFDPKQFAVDEGLQLKLVDIDAREWVPYAPLTSGNFGSDLICSTDDDCTAYIAQFGIDRRLEKGKRPLPLDFSCDTGRGSAASASAPKPMCSRRAPFCSYRSSKRFTPTPKPTTRAGSCASTTCWRAAPRTTRSGAAVGARHGALVPRPRSSSRRRPRSASPSSRCSAATRSRTALSTFASRSRSSACSAFGHQTPLELDADAGACVRRVARSPATHAARPSAPY